MTRILGIDPGLNHTGWGIIDSHAGRVKYIACGTITTNPKEPLSQRLLAIAESLTKVMATHRPEAMAIEETFVNRNALSSLKLGHARGAIMLTAAQEGLQIEEYAARLVKQTVTGSGKAEKQQVQRMVNCLLPGSTADSADAADALAVALCHGMHARTLKVSG